MVRLHRIGSLAVAGLALASLACATLLGPGVSGSPTQLPTQVIIPPEPTRSNEPDPTPETELSPEPTAVPQPTLDPVDQAPVDLAAGLLPGQTLPEVTTRYALDVTVVFNADGTATLTGRSRFIFTNREAGPIEDLVLMLWPNHDDQYLSTMTLDSVTSVAGPLTQIEGGPGDVVQRYALPAPLAAGESLDVSTAFRVVARPGIDESGAARFGLTNDVLLAPTFYPLVPRRIAGAWDVELAAPGGDTTNSDTATYVYVVRAPSDLAIVASGIAVDERVEGDQVIQTLVAAPMRDLALVVGPLTRSVAEVDGVTLNAYMLEEHAEFADDMLAYGTEQVRVLNQKIGPYPFKELDLVDAPGAFGGIEYPGEIFIGVVGPDPFFEIATVHEVGHQWFYSVLGDDQLREPWLDEAFASYTEVLYFEATQGADARASYVEDFRGYYQVALSDERLPIGLPVGQYRDESDYYAAVYAKGAVFLDTLRTTMGDDAFFAFLQAYYSQNRFGFVTGPLLQQTAESTCGCDLGPLFAEWVYGPDGPPTP